MALPTLAKTWQWYGMGKENPASGNPLTDHRAVLQQILEGYTTFGLSPWTVVRSSDGSTAASSNLITGVTKWNWAPSGSAHTWVQLRQAGIASGGSGMEVVIDCNLLDGSTQGPKLTVVVSPTGFAGGTVTDRPTSANEYVWFSGFWLGTNSATASFGTCLKSFQSTDGQATRTIIHIDDVPLAFWAFDRPQLPTAGWLNAHMGIVLGAQSLTDSVLTYAKLFTAAAGRARINAINAPLYAAVEGYAGQAAGARATYANDLTGEWDLYPVSWRSEAVGAKGRMTGSAVNARGWWDAWFAASSNGQPVDYAPAAGTRDLIQFGCLVLPWDNSVALTTI